MNETQLERARERQLDNYLAKCESGDAEEKRLTDERERKVAELIGEFEDMLADLNKEYSDLEPLTIEEIL